ncbi:MAG: FAD-dependent oxidoreductase [Halomonas sp.]|jgi:nitrite reductase (NADH) large subunit|uniref:NAD(P)/FAD-dependent oxidoreductase n=1 Tax=Billgrantia tianxiuensis TaxID=2497861 RepID=A0A6I6SPJ9_9GAMM|nr:MULTISPECIES: FAD-dependent oxidoreductase [Halomonas]MCE8032757.1 NAD(P)/FAD-dependent oxidoreductase [Halomonas sp. MCCC 1A11057]MDX5434150.1 FAD-dependent oxidoreductase [Halomonas sp.]QHC49345.1 NAD(P)/FAD-dependent oxidoreductase [Halomonas tianxiuensis]
MPRRHPETSTVEHLVIVGNGMAGHRLVEALLARTERPARITVIGAEQAPAYNRILLSPLLAGEMQREALTLRSAEWYAEQGIELILGERVEKIDCDARTLSTDADRRLDYDRLVLATGSNPARPPVPGLELPGVHVFRDLHDADALARAAESGRNAVVIGGGLLGLEAAEGLRKRGMQVSLLQRDDRLMNRQLDLTAARLLENELRGRGLDIHTDAQLERLEADAEGQVCAALLADGTRLAADCVVVAIGIVPNAELGRVAGLEVNRGVIVDEWLTTSDPAIHALGECCEHRGNLYGLVEPIWRQVEVLAERLCLDHDHADDEDAQGYVEKPTATKLKVSGISLYAFGPTEAEPDHEVLSYRDPQQGDYRRLLLRGGRLEGAVLYGDTASGPWYFEQALAGRDLTACRAALLLGAADAQALLDDASNESPHSPAKEAA